jgi:hypothetical protein
VIAFRGLEIPELINDYAAVNTLLAGEIPAQFHAAWEFYDAVRALRPSAQISLTGHSLGGALASLVFVRDGERVDNPVDEVVVFNPVPARETAELIVNGRIGPGGSVLEPPLGGSLEHTDDISRLVIEGEVAATLRGPGAYLGTQTLVEVGNEGSLGSGADRFDLHAITIAALLVSKGLEGDLSFPELSRKVMQFLPEFVNDELIDVEGFPKDGGGNTDRGFAGFLQKLFGRGQPAVDTLHQDLFALSQSTETQAAIADNGILTAAYVQFLLQFSAAQVEAERPAEDFKAVLAQAGGALIARLDRFNQDGLSVTGSAILGKELVSETIAERVEDVPAEALSPGASGPDLKDIESIAVAAGDGAMEVSASSGGENGEPEPSLLVIGEDQGDTLTGGAKRDILLGGAGDDRLDGGAETDVLLGEDDDDRLNGGEGDDYLFGGAGRDFVDGGEGADELTGGAENDTFIVDGGDTILDIEGSDRVVGPQRTLTGGTRERGSSGPYERAGDTYRSSAGDLKVDLSAGGEVTIKDFSNGDGGIELDEHGGPDGANGKVNSAANFASPLVLDLDGDGLELTLLGTEAAYFDHDEDGFAERTAWVLPDDGLLARDLDGDGEITQAAELFGATGIEVFGAIEPDAANGFAKLAELDFAGDQVIDASDPGFANLRVWRDENGDGIGQALEPHHQAVKKSLAMTAGSAGISGSNAMRSRTSRRRSTPGAISASTMPSGVSSTTARSVT